MFKAYMIFNLQSPKFVYVNIYKVKTFKNEEFLHLDPAVKASTEEA